jgi:trehalose 6-phosphate phosphatase
MMRDVDGRVSHVTEVDTRLFRQATAALVIDPEIVAAGVRVEEKPGSVALHTRGLEDPAAATRVALAAAERTARGLGLLVRAGRMVVEIRPPGVDKGTAVDALLDRAAVKAALYVGDDTTDVDAMRALARRRSSGLQVLLVGVRSAEMPDGLAHLADSLIEQDEVELLLRALLDRSP